MAIGYIMPPRKYGVAGRSRKYGSPNMVPSKYGAIHLSFEGDARRQVARAVPRCLQPLQGWLTFWASSGGGAVLATGYFLAPLIRGACGRSLILSYSTVFHGPPDSLTRHRIQMIILHLRRPLHFAGFDAE